MRRHTPRAGPPAPPAKKRTCEVAKVLRHAHHAQYPHAVLRRETCPYPRPTSPTAHLALPHCARQARTTISKPLAVHCTEPSLVAAAPVRELQSCPMHHTHAQKKPHCQSKNCQLADVCHPGAPGARSSLSLRAHAFSFQHGPLARCSCSTAHRPQPQPQRLATPPFLHLQDATDRTIPGTAFASALTNTIYCLLPGRCALSRGTPRFRSPHPSAAKPNPSRWRH